MTRLAPSHRCVVLVALVVGAGVTGLTGCSDEPAPGTAFGPGGLESAGTGVVPTFCFAVEPVVTGALFDDAEMMTPAESREVYEGAAEDVETAVAPAAIEDDWVTLSSGMLPYLKGMAAADTPAADVAELAEALRTDELHDARAALEEYTDVYCGPIE